MQSLLNELHSNKNSKPDTKTARRNLRHYIYTYCACQIWQGITVRAPRFGHEIVHFFLHKNGKDLLLNKESFDVKTEIPETTQLHDQDETWLWEQLRDFDGTGSVMYKLESIPVANSRLTVRHLVLNREVLWNLYRFAAARIRHVHQATCWIRTYTRKPQPGQELSNEDRKRMETFLDDMHSAFYRLHHLLHRCPSFWRLVQVLGSTSLQKLEESQASNERGSQGVNLR